MLGITAWSLVVASFLLIGIFGYASVWREPQSIALELGRPVFMFIGAAVSANYLNTAAYRIFTQIDVDTFKQYGSIQEDQMQPDMPNLMTGLIMFGWIFFVAGMSVSRLIRTRAKNHDSEHGEGGKASPPPLDRSPMKRTLLGLVAVVGMVACEPSTMDGGSDPAARVELVRERLKTIYMEDRIDVHYDGGDIGTYLSQFVWSDAAIILAGDRGIEPFLAFFDSLRAAALDQNLTKHSPINNTEIPMIFRSAFPDRKLFIKTQFGDIMNAPLSVDRFYQILESYRDRAPVNQQGESGRSGD